MPALRPIKRQQSITNLRRLGFAGPFPHGKHQIMERGEVTAIIPNPHRGDISVGLLARILRQAGISREEWEAL